MQEVLWLSHFLPFPAIGGMRQRSHTLLKHLDRRISVTLLSFAQSGMHKDEDAVSAAEQSLGALATIRPSVTLVAGTWRKPIMALGALVSGRAYNQIWLESNAYRRAIRESLRHIAPDVVHFDTISLAPYLSEIPEDVPCVLTHHNIESEMLFRRSAIQPNVLAQKYFHIEAQRLRRYEAAVANRFSRHIVCSDLDAERLERMVPRSRISIVPNGVDTEYFCPDACTDEEPDSLVFVGGLSWYPNASAMRFFVTQVWPLLKKRRRGVRMTIVGKHPPDWLERIATEDPSLSVTGFVPDMRPIARKAAVYVCPIFDGGGTKVKMLDALALGKAIVAHPVACEGLSLQNGKDVVMAETPKQFSDTICGLLDDESARRSLGRNARATAENCFAGPVVASRLSEAYFMASQASVSAMTV